MRTPAGVRYDSAPVSPARYERAKRVTTSSIAPRSPAGNDSVTATGTEARPGAAESDGRSETTSPLLPSRATGTARYSVTSVLPVTATATVTCACESSMRATRATATDPTERRGASSPYSGTTELASSGTTNARIAAADASGSRGE